MSWALASFCLVAVALLLGWIAYERSRPSARMVAVVASLAALTALGRDAFVALPDVKPVTAMTFATGYALGPLPGFTVGALGMLASNILLGEGPYTPWQMVAWGAVGLLGALLGRVSGRRLGRLSIAVACAISALGAKEVMNTYVWSIGGVYTPAALLARVGEGLPFDITDVVSSFIFGLAFAPELARLLARVQARMHVRWEPVQAGSAAILPVALALAALAAAGATGPSAHAATPPGSAIARALSYLERAQNADGGFPGEPGERSSELYSAWAAMALAAGGRNPAIAVAGKRSVIDSLRAEVGTLEGPGDVERTMLALRAGGAQPQRLGGVDLEARLLAARSADGSIGDQVNLTAFAILALRAAGHPPADPMIHALALWTEQQQNPDGGFSYAPRRGGGAASDVDDTGGVIEALAAAGVPRGTETIARAVAYLRHAQNADGGFPEQAGGESDTQSTAWAVQGLVAAGVDVRGVRRPGATASPLVYLESLQAADGSFRYSRSSEQSPVWVTSEVLPALAGRTLPIAPVATAPTTASAGLTAATSAGGRRGSRAGAASGLHGPRPSASAFGAQPANTWMPAVVGGCTRSLSTFAREALGHVGVFPASAATASASA